MRMKFPPKKFFPHQIIYREYEGKGSRGSASFKEPKVIEPVRFDDSVKLSPRDVNSEVGTPNALISVLEKYAGELSEFIVGSEIEFKHQTYTISDARPLLFDNDVPFGYEIEVV
ncbi:putative minor capsid protein [Enterococcus faecium]|uniref:putative minor capsid protein n=1 Tax=Enterococcus faecium TaxID=1352 RepID=UPI001E28FA81|nr:putative minor capsid protein [Enterococcus faecium]